MYVCMNLSKYVLYAFMYSKFDRDCGPKNCSSLPKSSKNGVFDLYFHIFLPLKNF